MKRTIRRDRLIHRAGFTLSELLIVLVAGAAIGLAVMSLMMATYRIFTTEMQQNQINQRSRQLLADFASDAGDAVQVMYSGTGPFTPPSTLPPHAPQPAGQLPTITYSYPHNSQGQSITSIPAGANIVVFAAPSYDTTGNIPNSYDYIGYSFTQSTSSTSPGKIVRTCIPDSRSSRVAWSNAISGALNYGVLIRFQFRVGSTSIPVAYAANWYDSAAKNSSGNYLFQGASPTVGVSNVDEVLLDATLSTSTWGQQVSQQLTTRAALRNW